MNDSNDIIVYKNKVQEQRMFQLLIAVDDSFEAAKTELLKKEPFSPPGVAYTAIRWKEARMAILKGVSSEHADSS